jgi:hypothetical protein
MLFVFSSMSCNRGQESEPSRLSPPLASVAKNHLRAGADFAVFKDQNERSRALFLEASRVLLQPRCANCQSAPPFLVISLAQIPIHAC